MESILELRSAELTALFTAFTRLGDAGFFLLFVPLGYWLWRPGLFIRFSLLLLASTMLNVTLKEIFQVPRPDAAQLIHAVGWSFPSGHAQNAAAIWPWLALQLRSGLSRGGQTQNRPRRWLWPLVALVVTGVATSRVYLGVHTLRDVVAGVALGGALAGLAWWLGRAGRLAWWQNLGPRLQVAMIAAGVAAWAVVILRVSTDPAAPTAAGGLAGFWIGSICSRHHLRFVPARRLASGAAVVGLGLAGVLGLRIGLKATFLAIGSTPAVADLIRYFAIASWISYLAPWLFLRLGLVGREA